MLWLAIGAFGLSLIVNIAFISRWSGRVESKQKAHDEILDRHEKAHDFHYKQARDHESNDQKHFADTDMHWNKREREWLNQRFLELGDRFDKIEAMLRAKS